MCETLIVRSEMPVGERNKSSARGALTRKASVEVVQGDSRNLRRSGEHALERRATRRLAVRGQHALDWEVEQQRAEPLQAIVARKVLTTAE